MLKQNWRLISRLEKIGDFLIVIVAFFAAYAGREALIYWKGKLNWQLPLYGPELAPIKDYFIVLLVALAGYGISLHSLGAYSSMRMRSTYQIFKIAVLSSLSVLFSLGAVLFLLKLDLSRSYIALFCFFSCLGLLLVRIAVLRLLRFWRKRGRNFRNIIVCGVGEQAVLVARQIAVLPELGIRIRGFAQLKEVGTFNPDLIAEFRANMLEAGNRKPSRVIIGKAGLVRVIEQCAVDEVIFTDVIEVMPQIEDIMFVCAEKGVRTTMVADFFSLGIVKSGISYFGELPLIHYQTPPGDGWELGFKRFLDIAISATLMFCLLPCFLLIAAAVKLTSPGPVIFAQRRVGLNGRLFYMYKFRSMYLDAARQMPELRERNEMSGPVFKMKSDPRVTPVGRFLRRFSFDELPQLWNVLKGDMSLVGPRPPLPGEVSLYDRKNRRRLSMRPGITCTWQVSGRNEIKSFEDWVRLDLDYIDNWSLSHDFMLLLRTIPAVLLGIGAR